MRKQATRTANHEEANNEERESKSQGTRKQITRNTETAVYIEDWLAVPK